jgi:hypothetical protein
MKKSNKNTFQQMHLAKPKIWPTFLLPKRLCNTSLQDPDSDEGSHMELGSDGRQKGQAGCCQEAEPVDPFDPEHLG